MVELPEKQALIQQHTHCKVAIEGRNFLVFDCPKDRLRGFETVPDGDYKTEIPLRNKPISRAWTQRTDTVKDPENPLAGIDFAVKEGFEFIGGVQNYFSPDDKVIIKVNLGSAIFDDLTRVEETVTHPDVIASVVKALTKPIAEEGAGVDPKNIYVAEADSTWVEMDDKRHDVKGKFSYTEMIKDTKINFLNLTKDEWVPFNVMGEKGMIDITFPRSMLKDKNAEQKTKIISIAPMKRHFTEGVTLTQKNMFGAIPEPLKVHYHQTEGGLKHIIGAASRIMRPDVAINDGVIGCALDHAICVPVNLKRLIISNDAVCADRHGADVMKFPAEHVPHLQLAIERGDGDPNCELEGNMDRIHSKVWDEYDLGYDLVYSGNSVLAQFTVINQFPRQFIRTYAKDALHPAVGFLNMLAVAFSTGISAAPTLVKEVGLWG